MFDDDDDDLMPPVPAHIAALERAAAAALIDEAQDRDPDAAGLAAFRELADLMKTGDRDALYAMFRLSMLPEDLRKAAARRRRPRRRVRQ